MNLANYYNRFNPEKNFNSVMIRDGYAAQGAEQNEIQSILNYKLKAMGDALFKEGDIINKAQLILNPTTGEVLAQEGMIYIEGAVRKVKENFFTVPLLGTIVVGVYLIKRVITEIEDSSLYNPAIGSEAEGEPGAAREKLELVWGWKGDNDNDGMEGDFFPIHFIDSGNVRVKDIPPQLDSTSRAIAKYDRDSAGGTYIIQGLYVHQEIDLENNMQQYTVQEGRARVYGEAIELPTSRRILYAADADILLIEGETHGSNGEATQEIFTHRNPIARIKEVRITIEKTATLSHGSFIGCHDALPDNAVIGILEIKQGGVTYTQGTDYKFNNGKIDWSLEGLEPATGSSYTATYRFRSIVSPSEVSEQSFTVQNAASNSTIDVSYEAKMPRIDRLVLSSEGTFQWIKGIACDNPLPPLVPDTMLLLASVYQSWQNTRYTACDSVKVVQMKGLMQFAEKLDWLTEHMARQNLTQELTLRETGAKKGLFVDPFFSDTMRDQGLEQNAAIVNGELVLPVENIEVYSLNTLAHDASLDYVIEASLSQLARTGSMLVNPYSAFDPLPADAQITPNMDRWTKVQSNFSSPVTQIINNGIGIVAFENTSSTIQNVSTTTQAAETLRQINIDFEIKGFGNNEELKSLSFDGIQVNPLPRI